MELLSYFDLHTVYLVIFSIGLSIAAGAAILSNLLFIISIRDGSVSQDEYRILRHSRNVVWVGVVLYTFSGVGLFTLSAEAMLGLGIFYANMTIATLMGFNAFVFQFFHLPRLQTMVGNDFSEKSKKKSSSNFLAYLLISEAVSVASWVFIVLHHAMFRFPGSYAMVMAAYCFFVLAVGVLFALTTTQVLTDKNKRFLAIVGVGILVLAGMFSAMVVKDGVVGVPVSKTIEAKTEGTEDSADVITTYTLREVAMHSNIEDCWVVIDGRVYDATPAAEKYPAVYACGTDSSENYRTITPDGISDRVKSYEIGLLGFTSAEIAANNTKEACWLVIDNLVFDMTEEAKLHPAAFNCGTDASVNYHHNHGKGISDKQMKFFIGAVDDGVKTMESGNPDQPVTELKPYSELYVEAGSWDNHELMVIVEKDAEKLLFMDGSTHTELGRIHDIGFQPHTSVYSEDARYMFIIARDGWLTKVDLNTFEPVKSIKVGESSRGTALTDDGKYLAIGNYIPGNIVMVDPITLDVLKTIPAVGEIDGEEVESRVGAMVEAGDKVIAALKDLNSVWVIDTSKPDFPIIEKHWNIGENATPLHDAFLSADGKFYIVASMGSKTVWVMDTNTWQPVTEVETGETPHTGPGATWGNKIYIPALGEGLITAIDMDTWEPVSHIKTAGPGLFIRSYPPNPDYPYVWTETAFGEFHDEIYVIDARTDEIVKTIRPVEGESSWHPEFTLNGQFVYIVSQTANEIEVYDAWTFELVKRITAETPSAVSNIGIRIEEKGL